MLATVVRDCGTAGLGCVTAEAGKCMGVTISLSLAGIAYNIAKLAPEMYTPPHYRWSHPPPFEIFWVCYSHLPDVYRFEDDATSRKKARNRRLVTVLQFACHTKFHSSQDKYINRIY